MTIINKNNGNGHKSNGANGNGSLPANWIAVDPDKFAFTPRKLRVVCIGAGISGLTLAHDIKHKKGAGYSEYIDLTIYDKNHEVGGTWIEHNYPGLRWYVDLLSTYWTAEICLLTEDRPGGS